MIYSTRNKQKDYLIIILMILCIALMIIAGIFFLKQSKDNQEETKPSATPEITNTPEVTAEPTPSPTPYEYIDISGMTIETRIRTPEGFTRVEAEEGSFADYIRNLPLKVYTGCAQLYDETVNDYAPWYAVVKQTICKRDIQQCVDTVIRFWAEYLFENGRYDEITFDFYTTPVFHCDFNTWASGKRVKIVSNKPVWYDSDSAEKDDYSYENLTKYLEYVYVYANTISYKLQTTKISYNELSIGDMVITTANEINAENPNYTANLGHAMLVADMAVNEAGEKIYLLLEGNTPATQPYIISSRNTEYGGIWVKLSDDGIYTSARGLIYPADAYRRLG